MSRSSEHPEKPKSRQVELIDAALRQVESAWSTDGGHRAFPEGSTNVRPLSRGTAEGLRGLKGYRVEAEVHRGGQGVVYRAIQESTGKTVAIKVVLGGRFAGRQQMGRFEREVRILARLRHPHIVTIHDRGVVDGVPYFVMDFIDGLRLDRYVQQERPPIEQRLRLLAEICSAVHAAHLHGVIHRDLKPGNLIVDQDGHAQVLDFGLAKPIDELDDAAPDMTETGQFVGSLPWASPEQVSHQDGDIDLRTDVYSLGVILYQLLTETLPYSVSGAPNEVISRIVTDEPKDPRSIAPVIDADLATIALKALEKDRGRRYQGAGALADDIRRYLQGEPIDAKRSSLWYLLRRRVQRHKWLAALAAMTAVSIVAGLFVSLAFWRLADQRAKTALRSARQAQTVQKFLTEMMASANSMAGGKADITVREMIDESARQLEERSLADEPDIESHLRLAIGRTYGALGLFDESQRQLERARELALRHSAREDEHSLEAWLETVALLRNRGQLEEAERQLGQCLAAARQTLGEQHLLVAHLLNIQAAMARDAGEYEQAEATGRQAIQIVRRIHAPPEEQATFLNDLALTLDKQGRVDEAIEQQREAVAIARRTLGSSHANTATSLSNLAGFLAAQGETAEAEGLYEEALDVFRKAGGRKSLRVAAVLDALGRMHSQRRESARAAELHAEALSIRRQALPENHILIAHSLNNLALAQYELGKLDEALAGFGQALDIYILEYGEDHPAVASFLNNIASVAWARGQLDLAAQHLRRSLEIDSSHLPIDPLKIARGQHNLACVLEDQQQLDEAESLLREALAARMAAHGSSHTDSTATLSALSRILRKKGELDEAEALARQSLEIRQTLLGRESIEAAESLVNLAHVFASQGRHEEAMAAIDEAFAIGTAALPADHWRIAELHGNRGKILLGLGRREEAVQALEASQQLFLTSLGPDNRRVAEVTELLESLRP